MPDRSQELHDVRVMTSALLRTRMGGALGAEDHDFLAAEAAASLLPYTNGTQRDADNPFRDQELFRRFRHQLEQGQLKAWRKSRGGHPGLYARTLFAHYERPDAINSNQWGPDLLGSIQELPVAPASLQSRDAIRNLDYDTTPQYLVDYYVSGLAYIARDLVTRFPRERMHDRSHYVDELIQTLGIGAARPPGPGTLTFISHPDRDARDRIVWELRNQLPVDGLAWTSAYRDDYEGRAQHWNAQLVSEGRSALVCGWDFDSRGEIGGLEFDRWLARAPRRCTLLPYLCTTLSQLLKAVWRCGEENYRLVALSNKLVVVDTAAKPPDRICDILERFIYDFVSLGGHVAIGGDYIDGELQRKYLKQLPVVERYKPSFKVTTYRNSLRDDGRTPPDVQETQLQGSSWKIALSVREDLWAQNDAVAQYCVDLARKGKSVLLFTQSPERVEDYLLAIQAIDPDVLHYYKHPGSEAVPWAMVGGNMFVPDRATFLSSVAPSLNENRGQVIVVNHVGEVINARADVVVTPICSMGSFIARANKVKSAGRLVVLTPGASLLNVEYSPDTNQEYLYQQDRAHLQQVLNFLLSKRRLTLPKAFADLSKVVDPTNISESLGHEWAPVADLQSYRSQVASVLPQVVSRDLYTYERAPVVQESDLRNAGAMVDPHAQQQRRLVVNVRTTSYYGHERSRLVLFSSSLPADQHLDATEVHHAFADVAERVRAGEHTIAVDPLKTTLLEGDS